MKKGSKAVELNIEDEERKLSRCVKQSPVAVVITDLNGNIEYVNPKFIELTGYSFVEVNGEKPRILQSGAISSEKYQELWETISSGKEWHGEFHNNKKNGELYWESTSISPIKNDEGEITNFIAVMENITKRKDAEYALRENEERYHAVTEAASDAIILADSNGTIIDCNRVAREVFGYEEKEILGKPMAILMPERFRQQHQKKLLQRSSIVRDTNLRRSIEVCGLKKDGIEFPIELSVSSWKTSKGLYYSGILRDMSERKLAEQILEESYEQTEQLLASISSIMIGVGPTDRITRWNKAAEDAFGIPAESVIGKPFVNCSMTWDWLEVLEQIAHCRNRDEPTRIENIRYTKSDGKERFLSITINPIANDETKHAGYLLLATDITERKIIEHQLSQAQKLESIGQLAAGIAHEINTPIQYVGDNTRFLQDAFNDLKDILAINGKLLKVVKKNNFSDELIAEIEKAITDADLDYLVEEIPNAIEQSLYGVKHVASIVRAMKEFSHPGTKEKTAIDINKAIENTITVARNEWKYVAELEQNFDASLPTVPCLAGDFNQVILNMIINAAHAIAEANQSGSDKKGIITISTLKKDKWVEIRITDTGTGIPEKIRQKIFDPFFTTKEVGKGTGQGLAICHSIIVEKHLGTIDFETEMGKGTTFVIRLPLS